MFGLFPFVPILLTTARILHKSLAPGEAAKRCPGIGELACWAKPDDFVPHVQRLNPFMIADALRSTPDMDRNESPAPYASKETGFDNSVTAAGQKSGQASSSDVALLQNPSPSVQSSGSASGGSDDDEISDLTNERTEDAFDSVLSSRKRALTNRQRRRRTLG